MHVPDTYDPLRFPQGVPNPYGVRRHPYPSYEHGADYTRPVFAMPFMLNPFNVLEGGAAYPTTVPDPVSGLGQYEGEDPLRGQMRIGALVGASLLSIGGSLVLLFSKNNEKAAIAMFLGANALYFAHAMLGRRPA